MSQGPPEHVRRMFGLGSYDAAADEADAAADTAAADTVAGVDDTVADAEAAPSGSGWRYGDVVLERVHDRARAVWLSRTLSTLQVPGLRIARPVGALDGRWVVAGWRARQHLSGSAERRPDETVLAAVRLHQATAAFARPPFEPDRHDLVAVAERMAWGEEHRALDEAKGGRLFEILALSLRPVTARDQLVHAELFGTLLFDGDRPPGLVGFVPQFRPAEWGAAVAAVDAVAWGGADGSLLHRWAHLPAWPQLLLRASLFRLAWHALHPDSGAGTFDGLRSCAAEVTTLL